MAKPIISDPRNPVCDILLIQPPIRDFYLTRKRTLPYGLASIAAALIEAGFTVRILDALATGKSRPLPWPAEMDYLKKHYGRVDRSPFSLFHRYRHFGNSFEHIGRTARESGAFLIGISALCTAYEAEAIKTAETVKAYHPQSSVVIGGHHPTAFPREVMSCRAVDFILRGEGEDTLPLLAKRLAKRLKNVNMAPANQPTGLERIPGIVFRRADQSVHINSPAIQPDLDLIPPRPCTW